MNKDRLPWFYWIYQPYKWLILVPLFAFFTILFSLSTIIFSFIISPNVGHFFARIWGRVICYITPLKIFVKGKKNITKNKSYVLIANHQTAYDIFLFSGFLPINFKWIMKKELLKVPFLGYACKKAGFILINRSSPRAAIKSILEAKKKLIKGISVAIFPEGTRSGQKMMLPFKKGAFKIAVDLELDILPVTIVDSYKVMRKGFLNVVPAKIGLIIHKPITINDYKNDIDKLMSDARRILENES
ncbi:MAG: 1-acyl-sn-glycerol-3-phosphate acyltransferase [Marinilabiliaceae bacterium]|nr:1-acyl-sn-glycerol-3-phosphate acyltransferase [Marinilabiliaceae bacterium]